MGLRWRALITIAIAAVLGGLVYCLPWMSLGLHLPWPQSTSLGQRVASWQQATGRTQECVTCSVELHVMTKGSAVIQTPVMMKTEAVTAKKKFIPAVDSVGPTLKRNQFKPDRDLSGPEFSATPCRGTHNQVPSPQTEGDILTAPPFISQSKNPCWWNGTGGTTQLRLHCLPYFFLAGVSKCGSTDIFSRLTGHPQVIPPKQKEPRWFDRRRFAAGDYSFQWYVSNFIQAAWQISRDIDKFGMSSKVVGDGSPTYFWRNFHWEKYSGNEGCSQPQVLIPDIIQRLLPHAKFILSFRNPVNSIYSKYLTQADKGAFRSPEHFHTLVEREILHYQNCFSHASVRSCAYNVTLSTEAEVRLEKGLYVIFLADWFRVFPRKQIHIIRFEDYITDIAGHLKRMFEFLDLDAMPDNALRNLAALPPANTGQHYSVGQMMPATRQLLEQFYATFNAQLADLLGDKRFLWLP